MFEERAEPVSLLVPVHKKGLFLGILNLLLLSDVSQKGPTGGARVRIDKPRDAGDRRLRVGGMA